MATPARRTTTALRATGVGASTVKPVFGVVFNLHGTQVPVSTADIADAAKKGIEFTLPEPVDLGTLTDFNSWLNTQFGIPLLNIQALPTLLQPVIAKLTSLDVTVQEFHLKVPGSDAGPNATTQFTLGMKAMWPDGQGINLLTGVLSIDGVFMGATNEPPKT